MNNKFSTEIVNPKEKPQSNKLLSSTRDVDRTREKLVNHEPWARDLQAFRVFSQRPMWVITPVNP